jgi:pimeloyl-ACP methyl ester carboxylesterase
MNVDLEIRKVSLKGDLEMFPEAKGLVIFAHGSGSSRSSPRNQFVAKKINDRKIATLLFDLLTDEEENNRESRFDIEMLAERLIGVTRWCREDDSLKKLRMGYFGSSTGAAAALSAAAYWGTRISAVVSRGGRPDLAMEVLDLIEAPTLLILGSSDSEEVINLNRKAYSKLGCVKKIEIVSGAGHLFEEKGALEKVADLAGGWFEKYFI